MLQPDEELPLFEIADSRADADLKEDLRFALIDLTRERQPSAWELCGDLEVRFGPRYYWLLQEVLESMERAPRLTSGQLAYFRSLRRSEDLPKAMRGVESPKRHIESAIDLLVQKCKTHRSSQAYLELMGFMAKFRDYSPYNNMLVKLQNPTCGFYATATDWKRKHNRALKEDARPMLILAPMHPILLVYDLDQTIGGVLPEDLAHLSTVWGAWDPKWLSRMMENAARRDRIKIQSKTLSSTMSGFAVPEPKKSEWKMRIVLHGELDAPSQFGVLCHELAHIYLGHLGSDEDYWWPSRRDLRKATVEIEAESVAYLVCARLGLEGTSDRYLSGHLKGGDLPMGVSLDMIAKVAGHLEDMAKRLLPTRK